MNVKAADVRAAYEFLRTLEPFHRWKLPPACVIKFQIRRDPSAHGAFDWDGERLRSIAINDDTHTTLNQLLASVAHEMIHVKQHMLGRLPDDPAKHHNALYRRMRKRVCQSLGFDIQTFG